MKGLMPSSLTKAITKRHGVHEDYACDRFDLALKVMRIHKDAYGFVPTEWNRFLSEVKINMSTLSNPTKESFMSNLINLQVKRLAWIAKIINSDLDHTEDELLVMSMPQLRDLMNEVEPVVVTCTRGTVSGKQTVHTVVPAKKAA